MNTTVEIDFEIVSQNMDLLSFLKKELGLRYVKSTGKDYCIECPNPFHVEKNPSCYLSKSKLIYSCFGCGSKGTIVDLIATHKGIQHKDAIKYLRQFCGMPDDGIARGFRRRFDGLKVHPEFQLSTHYHRDWENAPQDIKDYVARRRFSYDVLDKYFIGYNSYLCSLTIPLIWERKIINIAERYVYPPSPSEKYKYMSGGLISESIWGLFEGTNYDTEPFFTEGIFDAIRLRMAGYNAFALINNRLYTQKLRLLLSLFKNDTWYLVPDNDDGGQTMVDDWKVVLQRKTVNVVPVYGYKDIDEAPIEEIHKMITNSEPLQDVVSEDVSVDTCDTVRRLY